MMIHIDFVFQLIFFPFFFLFFVAYRSVPFMLPAFYYFLFLQFPPSFRSIFFSNELLYELIGKWNRTSGEPTWEEYKKRVSGMSDIPLSPLD